MKRGSRAADDDGDEDDGVNGENTKKKTHGCYLMRRSRFLKQQQTWSPPSPLLRPKEFHTGKDTESAGFLAAPLGLIRAANAAAGIGFLPLPRLPLLPNKGAGDRCGHCQFDGFLMEQLPDENFFLSHPPPASAGFLFPDYSYHF